MRIQIRKKEKPSLQNFFSKPTAFLRSTTYHGEWYMREFVSFTNTKSVSTRTRYRVSLLLQMVFYTAPYNEDLQMFPELIPPHTWAQKVTGKK